MKHGKACQNCAAWEPLKPSKSLAKDLSTTPGRCRRLPPSGTGHWALTNPNDWCLFFLSSAQYEADLENGQNVENGTDALHR